MFIGNPRSPFFQCPTQGSDSGIHIRFDWKNFWIHRDTGERAANTLLPYKNLSPKKAKFSLCFEIQEWFNALTRKGGTKNLGFLVMLMCAFFLFFQTWKKYKKTAYVEGVLFEFNCGCWLGFLFWNPPDGYVKKTYTPTRFAFLWLTLTGWNPNCAGTVPESRIFGKCIWQIQWFWLCCHGWLE